MSIEKEAGRRRTFAIISHPDAGKTTLTEKLLLYSGAIHLAGSIKSRKAARHTVSDWMKLEQERGISVTSSVLQFEYKGRACNLLDTPGHADFSEDTYRTLAAVDSSIMLIDHAKGVESRTLKLFEVCRMRNLPIVTFMNKLDRDGLDPLGLIDEISSTLNLEVFPMNWPIGMGQQFKGIYEMQSDRLVCFEKSQGHHIHPYRVIEGLDSDEARALLGLDYDSYVDEIELVRGACHEYYQEDFEKGTVSPVYFGTALGNFGVQQMLDGFVDQAPKPQPRATHDRLIEPQETAFSGFVFKIQANMDPKHRDRIAFLRVCSGTYRQGMKLRHQRLGKDVRIADAVTFMAGDRVQTEEAFAGDIIGLHNHGTIQIGDAFSEGENHAFIGIPNFAPELFRRVRVKDPLRGKQLEKGVQQLAEEGATQMFKPLSKNELIVGAVGVLQFDVVAFRLRDEYRAECIWENTSTFTARWIRCDDEKMLNEFRKKNEENLAIDGGGYLTYLATSRVNLQVIQDRWPDVIFSKTREH